MNKITIEDQKIIILEKTDLNIDRKNKNFHDIEWCDFKVPRSTYVVFVDDGEFKILKNRYGDDKWKNYLKNYLRKKKLNSIKCLKKN